MPDFPDRTKHESALSLAVASVFDQHAPAWPKLAWGEFQDDLEETMQPHLAKVYAASREHAGEQLEVDDPGVEDHASVWAARYTPVLAGEIAKTTRDRAKAAESDYDPAPLFGQERADRIAITETTRANTAGAFGVVALLLLLRPEYEGPWWQVNDDVDGNVCEICLPLDGLPRREWIEDYPEGPPSPHVGCNCSLLFEKP